MEQDYKGCCIVLSPLGQLLAFWALSNDVTPLETGLVMRACRPPAKVARRRPAICAIAQAGEGSANRLIIGSSPLQSCGG